MFPVYEEKKENLHFRSKTSRHASPHLHNSIEFIYITEGTLELGMGQELYHRLRFQVDVKRTDELRCQLMESDILLSVIRGDEQL